jgi:hypothetical protein
MVKKKGKSARYAFSLIGVNIDKVEQKYGISMVSNILEDEDVPQNATRIEELVVAKRTPDVISFLDESKRLRKCTVSMIDFRTGKEILPTGNLKYKCFWDRNFIPGNVQAIGCPVKYNASRAVKTYYSEISKDKYSISEHVTNKRSEELQKRKDKRIVLQKKDYYETDGIFCSFNCCMAYIEENKRNPLYSRSESLLIKMYNDMNFEEVDEIVSAPDWRKLQEHGGDLTIEQYRESFNKIEYKYHGLIKCVSIGRLFEEKLKF